MSEQPTGDQVRKILTAEDRLDDITRARMWSRIEDRLEAPEAPHRSWRRGAAIGMAAVAAAATIVLVVRGRSADHELTVAADATLSSRLGPHARAALVGPARLELLGPPGDATAARLHGGTLLAEFEGGAGRSLRIEAGDLTVDIVGTLFAIEVHERHACVAVAHGTVQVTRGGAVQRVTDRQQLCSGDAAPHAIPDAVFDQLARHERSIALATAPVVAAAPEAVAHSARVERQVPPTVADTPEPEAPSRAVSPAAEPAASPPAKTPASTSASTPPPSTPAIAPPSTPAIAPPSTPAIENASRSASPGSAPESRPSHGSSTGVGTGTDPGASSTDAGRVPSTPRPASAPNMSSSPPGRASSPPESAPGSPAQATASVAAPSTAEALYHAAEVALAAGDRAAADRSLARIVAMPASALADQALFERARIAYQNRAFPAARRFLATLATLRGTPLAEPGQYLDCRIAVQAHDDDAERCFVAYRAAYPRSPHDLDVLAVLAQLAHARGGCSAAQSARDELVARYPRTDHAAAWRSRCPEAL